MSIAHPRRIAARWRDPLAVLVLFLLPLIVFAPVALLRATFYVHDVQHYFYPYHVLSARLLAQGQLPLWNQYAFSGLPLIGDGQTALFYPPNWLFLLLPGVVALNYVVLLQFSIAGAGSYLFARSIGLWRLPSFLAAVSYMFCGFMTARVVHLSILSGAALLPLVFFGVERALRTNRARWYAAAALAVALQTLAGHPQVPVYTALGVGLYVLVRASSDWRALGGALLRLAGIYALGYVLAAVQLVPWIELAAQSPRAAGTSFEFVFGSSMAGSNWLLFLFPYLYGSIGTSMYADQPMGIATAVQTWEHSAYVGILPLALAAVAVLGLFHKTKDEGRRTNDGAPENHRVTVSPCHRVIALALLLLLGLLMAAGKYTPLAPLIYATPVIGKLRDVERAIVLAAFALAMLAGCGLQELIEQKRDIRWRVALAALLIGLLPVGVLWLAQQPAFQELLLKPRDIANLRASRPNAAVPLLLALASAALLGAWLWNRRAASIPALMAGLVLLDLGSYAALFNPTTDPPLYLYQPGSVTWLRQDHSPYRVATWLTNNAPENRAAQEQLAVSWGMVYGIESINGFNSLQPRRYTDYLFSPDTQDVSYGRLDNEQLLQPDNPVLSSLNVKYLLVPTAATPRLGSQFRQVYANAEVRIYKNTRVYPRAYFADSARRAPGQPALLQAVIAPYFDGRRVALIEADQLPALPQPSGAPADVTITRMATNQIVLTTTTAEARLLVLSEMYFAGWHAYIDGVETPIYRTNYLFRGVVVPPGTHTVVFSYRPWSVIVGAAISALALLLTAWLLLRKERVTR